MKIVSILFLALISTSAFAASTTAHPFEIEFYTKENSINTEVVLTQSCRYEKIVWSDSAEWHTEYKHINLKNVKKKLGNGTVRNTISLKSKEYMSISGIFKPGKACMSEIKLTFNDANYAIGWANRFSAPIAIKIWDFGNYRGGDSNFDESELRSKIENKLFTFNYIIASTQVNVFLHSDGSRVSNLLSATAALNKKTGMPYRLK